MLTDQATLASAPPRTPASLDTSNLAEIQGVHVGSTGTYLEKQIFLLDNRVLNGKVGFEVLVPFTESAAGITFLVNRGFIPMGATRDAVADIPPLREKTQVEGKIYVGTGLDESELATPEQYAARGAGQIIIQVADPLLVEGISGLTLAPYVVRLLESDPNALPRYWPVTVMQPEKHRGYAVQWFLMALAVGVAWTAFSFPTLARRSVRRTETST